MHATIDLLMSYAPEAMYLTHFGQIKDPAPKAQDLHRQVDAQVAIARREKIREASAISIRAGLSSLPCRGRTFSAACQAQSSWPCRENDLELNAQGLGVWLDSEK